MEQRKEALTEHGTRERSAMEQPKDVEQRKEVEQGKDQQYCYVL